MLLLAAILVVSGLLSAVPAQAQQKIKIVATIGMITDIVSIVGGERVEVKGLMGPGVDPHLFQASAEDVRTLAGADIIFYGGLHLEGKMGEIFESLSRRRKVIAVSEAIPTDQRLSDPNYPEFSDPHVWFDVTFWSLAVDEVAKGLAAFDAANATAYAERATAYQKRLTALDEWVKAAILTIPEAQRVMITSHDAFRYYGRRYGLEVLALQGISTEAEASAEDVRRLAETVVKRKLPALFIETSVPQRTIEAVKAAVEAAGWNVKIGGALFSDAMGDAGTLEGTYIGMILHNTTTIVVALEGEAPVLPADIADYEPLVKAIVGKA
jgi:manganese/zinc/iron transport system substrate-binding protein